jgi:hypothetical protein
MRQEVVSCLGWQVVQEQEIESEMRYFLGYKALEVSSDTWTTVAPK